MRRANHDLVDIEGTIQGESERAYRFRYADGYCWLPKSQVEWSPPTSGRALGTMTMPEWLAMEKGLI